MSAMPAAPDTDPRPASQESVDALRDLIIVLNDATNHRIGDANSRIDNANKRIDDSNQRFDGSNKRLDGINRRYDSVNDRFDRLIKRLDGIIRLQIAMFAALGGGILAILATQLFGG